MRSVSCTILHEMHHTAMHLPTPTDYSARRRPRSIAAGFFFRVVPNSPPHLFCKFTSSTTWRPRFPTASALSTTTMRDDGRSSWRVVVTNQIPSAGISRLQACPGLEIDYPGPNAGEMSTTELCGKLRAGADALYCMVKDQITAEVLDAGGERLKVVSTLSVGYNHIDIVECRRRGIRVAHTPDVLTETTADTVLGLVLASCRRFKEATAAVENGSWSAWQPEWMCGADVHSSVVGIIGLGRIGAAVARRLRAFGCTILYSGNRPKPETAKPLDAEFVDLDFLLANSDIVIPLCPLSEHTKEMFDKNAFSKMKRSAVFVNAARGDLVKQDDLVKALESGMIFGAGLDVTTPEPLPVDSPLIKLPNCFILPHIGSASLATRANMARMAADNVIAAYKQGLIPHQVKM